MPPICAPAELVFSFEECSRIVAQHAAEMVHHRPESSVAPLHGASGAVLAEDLLADRDLPPFPRSTRDGFAFQSQDLTAVPRSLPVVMHIAAGSAPSGHIGPGEAAEISTGAWVPEGADCVVMREYAEETGDEVRILRSAAPGENIVRAGAEAREGATLVPRGSRITYSTVAVAAAVGRVKLRVYMPPKVAILATGNELVPADERPARHQIRNSNSYSAAAQVRAAGGTPLVLPIAPDDPDRLRESIRSAFGADLLLLTGGVSAGWHDLVEEALADFGAEFFFTGALMQPGKPVVFGRLSQLSPPLYFFGLPGNPISTMVVFETLVRPFLEALAGAEPRPLPFASAFLEDNLEVRSGFTRFLPARLHGDLIRPRVETIPWQGSGDIAARARANCYIVIPPDRTSLQAGETVTVLLA